MAQMLIVSPACQTMQIHVRRAMAALAKQYSTRYGYLAFLLILLGAWVIHPPVARAQQASAGVNGVVTDPSGAAVPTAQITLTNTATGVAKTSTSNNDGAYAFLNVIPGPYSIAATAKGFTTMTRTQITLEVNQTATFD